VAIGLARLDHEVTMATRYGSDSRGVAIANHLSESGVALIAEGNQAARTSSAQATIAADGSADYVFDLNWDLTTAMVPSGEVTHVHTGSIGATLQPGAVSVEEVLRREKEAGASVSYDPNARPIIMGKPEDVLPLVERLVGLSDVVKASDEDIAWLYPDTPREQVVSQWRERGVSLVVVTLGEEGVEAWSASDHVTLPAQVTTVSDTIGAGDSFMSGLLSALSQRSLLGKRSADALRGISREDLAEVLRFALTCAGITVSRTGANPPRSAEVAA
jgi:fructokinase